MQRILIAQWVDQDNSNAQVLNARAMLACFNDPGCHWVAMHYGAPDPRLVGRPDVTLTRLWRRHLWYFHKALIYQIPANGIFYPGPYWFDEAGLVLRGLTRRKVPVVSTLEGLVGDEDRERTLTAWAGHPVYCQRVSPSHLARIDRLYRRSDHIIAISPFLAAMGRRLYGEKVSVIPLGVEHGSTKDAVGPPTGGIPVRKQVVCIGSFQERKQPRLFLELARRFPDADFVWYGAGPGHREMVEEARGLGLENASFPGAIPNNQVSSVLAKADLFVLPSRSEGVPKVTQEAAISGLPIIVFGFYEAPTVVDGVNGHVVWSNEELYDRVRELLEDNVKAHAMGAKSRQLAADWSWDRIAPRWEQAICQQISS